MRILLTADPMIPVPPKQYGGIERIVDALSVGLQKRGHVIGLIAHPNSTSPVGEFFGWSCVGLPRGRGTWSNASVLRAAVRRFEPDVVHSFSRLMYMMPIMMTRIPKVMSYQREPSKRQISWATKLGGHSLTFTGCSEYIRSQGKKAGGCWYAIHNFVELGKLDFRQTVSDDAPLVFLSRVESIKGAHTAIAAARRTGRRLLIAGNHAESGDETAYWKEKILPHLGKDGIEYVGPVDDAQKNELLGNAAAMIVPIEWEEPFGIVFAESLACGTPVISCPRGALPEIVRHGVDGFLVSSLEQACAAIENLGTIDRRNCRQRAEQCFSSEVIIEQYIQLYTAVLQKRSN